MCGKSSAVSSRIGPLNSPVSSARSARAGRNRRDVSSLPHQRRRHNHARLAANNIIVDHRANRLRIGFGIYHEPDDAVRLAEAIVG